MKQKYGEEWHEEGNLSDSPCEWGEITETSCAFGLCQQKQKSLANWTPFKWGQSNMYVIQPNVLQKTPALSEGVVQGYCSDAVNRNS